jgi:hypothetical protein
VDVSCESAREQSIALMNEKTRVIARSERRPLHCANDPSHCVNGFQPFVLVVAFAQTLI